jgi:hypothetical protein
MFRKAAVLMQALNLMIFDDPQLIDARERLRKVAAGAGG